MSDFDFKSPISRRRALKLGGAAAAGGALSVATPLTAVASARGERSAYRRQHGTIPAKEIEKIVGAQGMVSEGVLNVSLSRTDIGNVAGPLGVTFTPAFEVDGNLTFEPLGDDYAFFNADLALKPEECNPFIDAIIANGMVFQALHQHYIETDPNFWFIHWRGEGEPRRLAHAAHNILKATSIPLPQTMPSNPKTPLNATRLGAILHGSAQTGAEGVVSVNVDRTDTIVINGVRLSPESNITTAVEIKPQNASGSSVAFAIDYSMTGPEVMPVVKRMRSMGWFQGCLYNQETDEHPQLYFDHMLKIGDPYELAREARRGLDLTASK